VISGISYSGCKGNEFSIKNEEKYCLKLVRAFYSKSLVFKGFSWNISPYLIILNKPHAAFFDFDLYWVKTKY